MAGVGYTSMGWVGLAGRALQYTPSLMPRLHRHRSHNTPYAVKKRAIHYSKRRAKGRGRPWSDLFVDVERRHLARAGALFSTFFILDGEAAAEWPTTLAGLTQSGALQLLR